MDEQIQAKIQEARDAGYSDEEIQQYLAIKDQPVPQQQPLDRGPEYAGMAQGMGAKALEYGAELYAGKKLIVDPLVNAYKSRAPVAPDQSVLNPTWDKALKQPVAPAPQAPTSALDATSKLIRNIALTRILPAATVGAGLFTTSPEEVEVMKQAEARKRAQGWKPLNER